MLAKMPIALRICRKINCTKIAENFSFIPTIFAVLSFPSKFLFLSFFAITIVSAVGTRVARRVGLGLLQIPLG
jgi:hypothetical protein